MTSSERTVMFHLPAGLQGTLACVQGTVAGRSWELTAGTFVIGRADTSDLNLPTEPGVSKVHAKIVAERDHYVIMDCESRNGTIVNGVPIQRQALDDGDEIRICGCLLRFTQRGGSPTRVRNADAPRGYDSGDRGSGEQPGLSARNSPSGGVSSGQRAMVTAPDLDASEAGPSRGRVLGTWYAIGLGVSLVFGGAFSAILVKTAPAEAAAPIAAAGADAGPVAAAAGAPDGAAPAAPATPAPAAAAVAGAAGTTAQPAAVPDAPPRVEPTAVAANDEPQRAAPTRSGRRGGGGGGGRSARSEAPAETQPDRPDDTEDTDAPAAASGKSYPATPDAGRSEAVRAKGGRVAAVNVADGDTVTKGQVLVTFESGASTDDVATLQDRIAALEVSDDEEARRELAAARAKLAGLTGGSGGGPVVANSAGKLSGFNVSVGQVLKNGDVIGRIGDGEVSHVVRINLDKKNALKSGQAVTLVLRQGGEAPGTVTAVNGKSAVVNCGDVSADDVDAVRP